MLQAAMIEAKSESASRTFLSDQLYSTSSAVRVVCDGRERAETSVGVIGGLAKFATDYTIMRREISSAIVRPLNSQNRPGSTSDDERTSNVSRAIK